MGQFSWLDCITGEQVIDNKQRDVYLLVPKPFEEDYGKRIKETYYDGYGNFGGYDVYDLVALWNRDHIGVEDIEVPKREQYAGIEWYEAALKRYHNKCKRLEDFISYKYSDTEMMNRYGRDYLREIGIDIGCYDEQNAALEYPIKITHDPDAIYEDCKPSKGDPNQGWEVQPKMISDYLDDIETAFLMFKDGAWDEDKVREAIQDMREALYYMDC